MFKYDESGKLLSSYVYNAEIFRNLYGTSISYDDQQRVSKINNSFDYTVGSDAYAATTNYSYSYSVQTGYISSFGIGGSGMTGTISPVYDGFGRTTNKEISLKISNAVKFYNKIEYDYHTGGANNYESGLVSSFVSNVGTSSTSTTVSQSYRYTYDGNSNITQITNASGVVQYKYTYDDLSQLIREDNRPLGYSYTYTYDNAGNILNKKRYSFTTGTLETANLTYNYSYDDATWGDLLTLFGGNYIAYDEIGNPIKIGNYDESMDIWWYGTELTWDGRELVSYRSFEYYDEDYTAYGTPITFTYNADGIRTSKTVNGVEHLYYLNGSQITAETWTSGGVEYMLMYVYDETGSPIAIKYRTSSYAQNTFDVFFFEKNLQGDIVAIYNSSGTKIGSYTYDAWGNFTVTTNSAVALEKLIVSTYNPFRYRGYYYDTDTALYYLQSRYYNAQWGRFLNADLYLGTGGFSGYNLFAYCCNNPVMSMDQSGEFAVTAIIIGVVVGAAIGFGATAYADYEDDGEIFNGSIEAKDYIANTIVGGAIGGLTAGIGGSSFTLTIPTLHTTLTTAGTTVLVAGSATVTITGTQIIGLGVATAGIVYFANRSGKEMANNPPSWVNRGMVDPSKNAQQNATNILNNKYGAGNWSKGPGTEYNKIVKWITRKIFFGR